MKNNEIINNGTKKIIEQGKKLFDNIDKQLPNTPLDNAGQALGKKICNGIDNVIDFFF